MPGLFPVLGPLWACWTRLPAIGEQLNRNAWSREARNQYLWLLRRMIRLIDADGHLPLDVPLTDDEQSPQAGAGPSALELVGDKGDAAAAAAYLEIHRAAAAEIRAAKSARCVARIGLVRPGGACRRLVAGRAAAHGRLRRRAATSGAVRRRPQNFRRSVAQRNGCDGQPIRPTGAWEELCWQSDKDCDFLELGIELAEGLQLERQIVLAKRDRALLIADIVSAKDRSPHKLRHALSLPFGAARGLAAGNGNA